MRGAKEGIIAAQQPHSVPEDTAHSLLSQGYGVDNVAARTGLSADTVARIADTIDRPDVSALVTAVHERLHDLGISQLAASKMGKLSRSTLATLGKAGKVPSDTTLAKLDELLSWEPGSARSTMFRSQPIAREAPERPQHPPEPDLRHGDYDSLAHQIDLRLRELNMSKSKFAAIGGPGRSTLATLGKRGYQPADDTLERIDRFLYWEPGSAEAVLKGGLPIRRGPTPAPHPSLVPLERRAGPSAPAAGAAQPVGTGHRPNEGRGHRGHQPRQRGHHRPARPAPARTAQRRRTRRDQRRRPRRRRQPRRAGRPPR